MPAPNLTTQRLLLRHWQKSDYHPFFSINSNPKVMEFFPKLLSENESQELADLFEEKLTQNLYGFWALEEISQNKFIGFVGLNQISFDAPFTPCIEIGWRLDPLYWGKGYAFEAAETVLKYAFENLKLKEILAFTAKHNLRSKKLMEKLGMKSDPKENFLHPKLDPNHPLALHVLYRKANPFK